MRLSPRTPRPPGVCDERRPRRHGYRLRCLEPEGHQGPHLWTPELLDEPVPRDRTRPAVKGAADPVSSVARRVGRLLDRGGG
jgi:hypothetical protein